MMFDLAIVNGVVITVNPDFDIITNGFVGISGDRITHVGPVEKARLSMGKETIDACGGIILPGLVNTHTHLPMTLFRGIADDLPLMAWLNDHIFPAEARHINRDSAKTGALLGCAEMILSGTTTCCDGYFFESSVAEAILESGMRAVVGQGVIDFPAPGVPDPAENIDCAIRFIEKWKGVSPRIDPSIFCHSPYTCSGQTLVKSKAAARRHKVLFQIHAAETRAEHGQIFSDHNLSPIEYLKKLDLMDEQTLIVHCIWVDENDLALIAKSGAAVSVNTESHMKLASGVAPAPGFVLAGIPLGIGTDGCAGNNDMDLFREMDMTAKLHKVNSLDPTVMNAQTVLKLATIGGAEAIGLKNRIGSLEVGKQADIIVVDTNKPHLTPMYHPVSHLVYAAGGSDVKDVIVAGKVLVKDYRLLSMDLDGIMEAVGVIAGNIKSA
jgi:5-methylthioadenosine/S-adenosylhomocysteine deaminase